MKIFLKITAYLISTLVLLAFIVLYSVYYWHLNDVKDKLVPSQSEYSQMVKDVMWVEYQGRGAIEISEITALKYMFIFFSPSMYSNELGEWKNAFPPSTFLITQTARTYSINDDDFRKSHPFPELAASFWISQNFTEDEIFATILENSYFGLQLHSISDVAKYYLDKEVEQLSLDDTVFLITILRSPSRLNPVCFEERHTKRAKGLQEKLNRNWPNKYGDYVYEKAKVRGAFEFLSCKE